jgi:AraC-like DNA-binding protein
MTRSLTITKQLSRPGPGSAPAAVARDLMRLVAEYEPDATAFLRAAALPHLAWLLAPKASKAAGMDTIDRHDFTRLYAHATIALDNHASRQEGREPLTKAGMDMLCHAIITCRTLHDVIVRLSRFSAVLAPRTGHLTLAIAGHEAQLTMATVRRVRNCCAYLSDLTGLASHHRLLGWLIGEDIPLLGAALRYPPLLGRRTVGYLLHHRVQHRAAENAIRFPARHLHRPVVRSHHELEEMLDRFPFDIAEPQSKTMPLSGRIDHLFGSMLASGEPLSTADALARQFSISVATLKRRLADEGTSLSQIKTVARLNHASQLLADPRTSIADVARRTQFSDAGAFRRAFRDWTGTAPSRWRESAGRG